VEAISILSKPVADEISKIDEAAEIKENNHGDQTDESLFSYIDMKP
jgi:hypothetical protein